MTEISLSVVTELSSGVRSITHSRFRKRSFTHNRCCAASTVIPANLECVTSALSAHQQQQPKTHNQTNKIDRIPFNHAACQNVRNRKTERAYPRLGSGYPCSHVAGNVPSGCSEDADHVHLHKYFNDNTPPCAQCSMGRWRCGAAQQYLQYIYF